MFINLTMFHSKKPLQLKGSSINRVGLNEDNLPTIGMDGSSAIYYVKESPDEILAMIEKAEDPLLSIDADGTVKTAGKEQEGPKMKYHIFYHSKKVGSFGSRTSRDLALTALKKGYADNNYKAGNDE